MATIRNRSAPSSNVVPMVIYENLAAALPWLSAAFGLRERLRYLVDGGTITHAQLEVSGENVMCGWGGPDYQSPARHGHRCQAVLVHVEDVDGHCRRARAAGAAIVREPETQPFGERSYEAEDLEGQRWHFSQHVRDVAPEEWGATVSG